MRKIKIKLLQTLGVIALVAFTLNNGMAQYGNQRYGQGYGYENGYDDDYYDDDYGEYGYHNQGYNDYDMFYNELSPYGNWMYDPNYGYVWMPRVGRDFRPYYTNGSWMMTDMGNMWMSNYSWGWIPFHYGRWVYNNFYGWLWIPGRQWAPAWVVWRQGGGYYGWSPMGPSINININFGRRGYYNNIPNNWWNFVPMRNIYAGNYHRYGRRNVNNVFINNTTIINNYNTYSNNRYFAGPRADDVRRVVGRDMRVYRVNNVNTRNGNRVSGDRINVYTPRISRVSNDRQKVTPKKFDRISSARATQVERVQNSRPSTDRGANVNNKNDDRFGNSHLDDRSQRQRVNTPVEPRRNTQVAPARDNNRRVTPPNQNRIQQEKRPLNVPDNKKQNRYNNQSDNNRRKNVQHTPNRQFSQRQAPQRVQRTTSVAPSRQSQVNREVRRPNNVSQQQNRSQRFEQHNNRSNRSVERGHSPQRIQRSAPSQSTQRARVERSNNDNNRRVSPRR